MQTNRAPDRLNNLVTAYHRGDVSDLHVHPGVKIRISRFNRLYTDHTAAVATAEEIESWIVASTGRTSEEILGPEGQACSALEADAARLRCTFRRSLDGISASFRLIPHELPTLDSLKPEPPIRNLIHRQSGLVIIEGGTGHGKSTLATAMLGAIGREYDKHLYLIEDPIEFVHPEYGDSSVIQREIGLHASDYPTAVQDALRSRPHVIYIGEMLNAATAKAALHAATTGHLVFTTAHAGSVTEAIEGFIGQFPADEQPAVRTRLSQSLLAVIVQRLVPAAGGGLAAAREVMVNDLNFAAIIRKADEYLLHGQLHGTPGCFTLEDSLAELVLSETISRDTARAAAVNTEALEANLSRLKAVA